MTTKTYTMYDIQLENKQRGLFWFEPDTLRFFSSRVSQEVYQGPGGIYFVTSEQNKGFGGTYPRLYSVRCFSPDTKQIYTVGEFQAYKSRSGAHSAAKKCSEHGTGIIKVG